MNFYASISAETGMRLHDYCEEFGIDSNDVTEEALKGFLNRHDEFRRQIKALIEREKSVLDELAKDD